MDEKLHKAVGKLEALYHKLRKERWENPQSYCHNDFRDCADEDGDDDIYNPIYSWQWNFTEEEYKDIKKNVFDFFCQNGVDSLYEVSNHKTCNKLIQLYISEWYKRESNGRNGEDALSAVGIRKDEKGKENLCKNICINLGVNENRVYKNQIDGGNCRWKDTIYVDGGLPLEYLLSKKTTAFSKSICNIIEQSDNYNANELGDLCDNNVVNQSYRARELFPNDMDASIYDFIQEVIIQENLVVEGFENFKEIIRQAKIKSQRRKFDIRYNVFRTDKYFVLTPQLYLKGNIPYSISTELLKEWGANVQGDSFKLEIRCNGKRIWGKRFNKCLRGDYIMFPKKDRFDINGFNELCGDQWNIYIDGQPVRAKNAINNPLYEKGFVQLYSTNGYLWSTQSTNNYQYSAILFDKNRCSFDNDQDTSVNNVECSYLGWKIFEDNLTIEVDGEEKILYDKAGNLIVEPQSIHKLSDEKHYSGYDADSNKMFLLNADEAISFNVSLISEDKQEEISIDDQVNIRYRYSAKDDFKQYNGDSINVGYVEFEITVNTNKKTKIVRCFALPSNTEIRNITNNIRTEFLNFGNLKILENNRPLNVNNDKKIKYWKEEWKKRSDVIRNPYISYRISDKDEIVSFYLKEVLPIDDAFVLKRKSNNLSLDICSKDNEKKVPILIANRIDAFKLPPDIKNGKIEITKYDKYNRSFQDLMNHKYDGQDLVQSNLNFVKFKTFTHTFSINDNGNPTLTKGNLDFSEMKFVFAPVKSPLSYRDIELRSNNSEYYFDVASSCNNEEGIIMQRIGKYECPIYYIKPIYVAEPKYIKKMEASERKDARFMRIGSYYERYNSDKDYKEAIDYFELATATGNYFGCFDALLGLVCKYKERQGIVLCFNADKLLAEFFAAYVERKGDNGDYSSLWRMADEFLFDWTLIPRDRWNENYRESVTELLANNPSWKGDDDYKDFIYNDYWDFDLKRRQNDPMKTYLEIILNRNSGYFWSVKDAIDMVSNRFSLLKEISSRNFNEIKKCIKIK